MAVTAAVVPLPGYPQSSGAKIECIARVTLTGTYVQGGFQVAEIAFGLSGNVNHIDFAEGSYEILNYLRFAVWRADDRFILHDAATGNETANATPVTGEIYLIKVKGT